MEAQVKVSTLLTDRRRLLDELARLLLEHEVVERDHLHALLAGRTGGVTVDRKSVEDRAEVCVEHAA